MWLILSLSRQELRVQTSSLRECVQSHNQMLLSFQEGLGTCRKPLADLRLYGLECAFFWCSNLELENFLPLCACLLIFQRHVMAMPGSESSVGGQLLSFLASCSQSPARVTQAAFQGAQPPPPHLLPIVLAALPA